ncbi:MAG: pilus assembly protein [Clostridia bacterium]
MGAVAAYAKRFVQEEEAVTIIEMVIIIAVILVVVFPTLKSLGEAEDARLKEMEGNLQK